MLLLLLVCTASSSGQQRGGPAFVEEAVARGVSFTASEISVYGHGVAFADLDDDGDADLVCVGGANGLIGVFENDGAGRFTDHSLMCGIPLLPASQGVIAADYDRDGDLDLYISRAGEPNTLIKNLGGFLFNVIANSQTEFEGVSHGSAWADYDVDGWPDLAVPGYTAAPNHLFRNLGDGTFENASVSSGFDTGPDRAFQIAFFDMDLDGDSDCYIASDARGIPCDDLGFRNTLLENVGGTFTNISAGSGTDLCIDAMCIAVGDFNASGLMDLYISNNPGDGHALLINNGDSTFSEMAAEAGVANADVMGWGCVFFDYNNDGLLDLYTCSTTAHNRLFLGSNVWPVVDVAPANEINTPGLSFAVATADIDLDGDLDLALQNLNEGLRLFINQGNGRSWARFNVHGLGSDRFGIGTTLQATTDGTTQVREVIAGSNFKSQNELAQHFGVDSATHIDELIVTWPGGTTRSLINIPVNHTWRIYPLDKCGDSDGDGDRDFDDYLAFAACFTGEDPTHWQPGCELFDYQGDSDVDLDDLDMFLAEYDDVLHDCDNNGVADLRDILAGLAPDADNNGQIDGCVPAVPGDVTGDDMVNLQDLLLVIGNWGSDCPECPEHCNGDANNDCAVNLADLLEVIGNWGTSL